MAIGIYMFLLILVNIQLSSQKPETSVISQLDIFQKKYDYMLADVMKVSKELENVREIVRNNRGLHDSIQESITRLDSTIRKLNRESANVSISYSREFNGKFHKVEMAVRKEKHEVRKRLSELQRELRTAIEKIKNNQNEMRMSTASKQQLIIDMVDTLQDGLDKIQEDIVSKQRVILENVEKLQADQDNIREDVAGKQRGILEKMGKLQNDQDVIREDVINEQRGILYNLDKLRSDHQYKHFQILERVKLNEQSIQEVTTMQTKSEAMCNELENEQKHMIAKIKYLQSKVASMDITIENQKNEIHSTKAIVRSKTLKLILDGWTQYSNSVYKAFYNKLNWTNAMTACRSFKGFLAEIQSEDEMKLIAELIEPNYSYFWLGGCDRETEGEWKWCYTNDDITYTNWYTGQPDNWKRDEGGEHCMQGYGKGFKDPIKGKWNDAMCRRTHAYVCEVPIAT